MNSTDPATLSSPEPAPLTRDELTTLPAAAPPPLASDDPAPRTSADPARPRVPARRRPVPGRSALRRPRSPQRAALAPALPAAQPLPQPRRGRPLATLRCAWVDGDEERLAQAQVVRLLVAEERRWTFAEPNLDAQRSFLHEVSAFLGRAIPERKVLVVAPAGCLTVDLPLGPEPTPAGLCESLEHLHDALRALPGQVNLTRAGHTFVVGVDGCVFGSATPLQTAVRLQPGQDFAAAAPQLKLFPAAREEGTLLPYTLSQRGALPEADARRLILYMGRGGSSAASAVLLAHELSAFSSGSFALSGAGRDALRQRLLPSQPLRYVLAPLHHLSTNHVSSYTAYLDAARLLQGQRRPGTPAQRRALRPFAAAPPTVVMAAFAPSAELSLLARATRPNGPHADHVLTLLIYDRESRSGSAFMNR